MSNHDISKYTHVQAAMKALMTAMADDGIIPAGLVICAVPVKGAGISDEIVVFTALRDDVKFDAGEEAAPAAPIMALYEQATRGIKRRMAESGS